MHKYAMASLRADGWGGRGDFTPGIARSLCVEDVLYGHHGCVNRLAWSPDGQFLASGSDDTCVMIRRYPTNGTSGIIMATDHTMNIFGVKFLPCTGNAQIVTGAMDNTAAHHTLDVVPRDAPWRLLSRSAPAPHEDPAAMHDRVSRRTTTFRCHADRVKQVEVEPMEPHLFWSASEDGTVRQYDLRTPMGRSDPAHSPNVLIECRGSRFVTGIKSLAINPSRPHMMALGCEDAFVRVYDRRKLSPTTLSAARTAPGPTLALAPTHLHLSSRDGPRVHCTYVSFSNKGSQLVATYHGDHAYAFDVTGDGGGDGAVGMERGAAVRTWGEGNGHHEQSPASVLGASTSALGVKGGVQWDDGRDFSNAEQAWQGCDSRYLPFKDHGNAAMHRRQPHAAVGMYSACLEGIPGHPMLLNNRAAAYLHRNYAGDAFSALMDAEDAIDAAPGYFRPYIKRAQALRGLGMVASARQAVDDFKVRFPSMIGEIAELDQRLSQGWENRKRRRGGGGGGAGGGGRGSGGGGAAEGVVRRRGEGEGGSGSGGEGGGEGTGAGAGDRRGSRGMHRRSGSYVSLDVQVQVEERVEEGSGDEERVVGSVGVVARFVGGGSEGGSEDGDRGGSGGGSGRGGEDGSEGEGGGGDEGGIESGDGGESNSEGAGERGRRRLRELLGISSDDEEGGGSGGGRGQEGRGGGGSAGVEECLVDESGQRWGPGPDREAISVGGEGVGGTGVVLPDRRLSWRWLRDLSQGGSRLTRRYVGHCNVHTDIKEACFVGRDDRLVACCSDCGHVFLHEAESGRLVAALLADADVANCCQPHPVDPVLATSGIESVVRIWAPRAGEGGEGEGGSVVDANALETLVSHNQESAKQGSHRRLGLSTLLDPAILQALLRAREREDGDEGGAGEGAAVRMPCAMQ